MFATEPIILIVYERYKITMDSDKMDSDNMDSDNMAQDDIEKILKQLAELINEDQELSVLLTTILNDSEWLPKPFPKLIGVAVSFLAKKSALWLGQGLKDRVLQLITKLPEETLNTLSKQLKKYVAQNDLKQHLREEIAKNPQTPIANINIDNNTPLEILTQLHNEQQFNALFANNQEILECLDDLPGDIRALFNDVAKPDIRWYKKLNDNELMHRLKFNCDAYVFEGRTRELGILDEFCRCDGAFKWLLMTARGGEGKTRLAYHFAETKLRTLWHHGRWEWGTNGQNANQQFSAQNWKPTQPTLIIFDYVLAQARAIHQILKDLSYHSKGYQFPVRALLIERTIQHDIWLNELLGMSGQNENLMAHRFKHEQCPWQEPNQNHLLPQHGLEIEPLTEQDVTNMLSKYLEKKGHTSSLKNIDSRQLYTNISDIEKDNKPRALFVIAIIEVIMSQLDVEGGQPITNKPIFTSVADLLEKINTLITQRYAQQYSLGDRTAYQLYLLQALATLCGGMRLIAENKKCFHADIKDHLIAIAPVPDDENIQGYLRIAGLGYEDYLPAIEPDILGEYFVWHVLNKPAPGMGFTKQQAFALFESAWCINPKGMDSFIAHFAQDLPDSISGLPLIGILKSFTKDKVYREGELVSGGSVVSSIIKASSPKNATLDDLLATSQQFREKHDAKHANVAIALAQATRAFNISVYDSTRADEMLKLIQALRPRFPDHAEIALAEAKLAFNISVDDSTRADDMLKIIQALREQFPKRAEIACVEARLTIYIEYKDSTNQEQAQQLLPKIIQLLKQFPDNEEITHLHNALTKFIKQ